MAAVGNVTTQPQSSLHLQPAASSPERKLTLSSIFTTMRIVLALLLAAVVMLQVEGRDWLQCWWMLSVLRFWRYDVCVSPSHHPIVRGHHCEEVTI